MCFLGLSCCQTTSEDSRGTPLPAEGPTTGSIIGAIIGVIIILAIIGTVIAMFRKHKNNVMNRDGPPKHKPPPPSKIVKNPSLQINASGPEDRLLLNQSYFYQAPEPVTDLDAHQDDDDHYDGEGSDGEMPQHCRSAAPTGWDDPNNDEVPPPYMTVNHDTPEHSVGRGDSFISSEVVV